MKIRDTDGDIVSLESRISTSLESDRQWKISALLDILVERVGLTEDDLLACCLIETGETIVQDDEVFL